MDTSDYIRALLHSHYTTITGGSSYVVLLVVDKRTRLEHDMIPLSKDGSLWRALLGFIVRLGRGLSIVPKQYSPKLSTTKCRNPKPQQGFSREQKAGDGLGAFYPEPRDG